MSQPSTPALRAFERFKQTDAFTSYLRDAAVPARQEMALWKAVAACFQIAEAAREEERRRNCKHPHQTGSGSIGTDGSGHSEWYCPDCHKGGRTEWPARSPQQNERSDG